MLSSCLKCRKNTESKNSKFSRSKTEEECFYQNLQRAIITYRSLSKSKKLVDY